MKTIIVATGKIDFISDGSKIIKIENGSELASKNCNGIGSFKAELMNNIFNLDSKKIEEVAKITVK